MPVDLSSCSDLASWLAYLTDLHSIEIDMGLERIATVRDRLGWTPCCPVVTIGGTNGKGSTATLLATVLNKAGYKVGLYTSPHLHRYNERICIDMQPVVDQVIVDAFTAINTGRHAISLTYFEFSTLAAMKIFIDAKVDVIVLEVGLGGRLDATNIFDPDVAAVVSVAMDHEVYLGDNREKIGFEKAGIFRANKPALCADPDPPQSLIAHAQAIGANLELYQRDFGYQPFDQQWSFYHGKRYKHALPLPALRGKIQLLNASLVLAILDCLRDSIAVGINHIKEGLLATTLPGRCQVLPGRPTVVLDVAHNPHAAQVLHANLQQMGFYQRTYAVFGMMRDKDIAQVLAVLKTDIDQWFIAAPKVARSAGVAELTGYFQQANMLAYCPYDSIADAYQAAYVQASENDRIVIFGSFYTVAEGQQARSA